MSENDVFAKAYAEFESPSRQIGLWARCFSDANGDESKAKAAYLQLRAKDLASAKKPELAGLNEAIKPRSESFAFERMNTAPPQEAKKSSWKLWLYIPLGLFGAFMTFGFFVSSSPEFKAKEQDRLAIHLCWSDQQRKSLAPATQRLVAGACESMESAFISKYSSQP